ncbi:MAG: hypothetical protein ACTSVR_03220 [Candidatus Thorarchaeota archaeon]
MAEVPTPTTVPTAGPTPPDLSMIPADDTEWQIIFKQIKAYVYANAWKASTYQQKRAIADRVQYLVQVFFALRGVENIMENGGLRFNQAAQQMGVPRNLQNPASDNTTALGQIGNLLGIMGNE